MSKKINENVKKDFLSWLNKNIEKSADILGVKNNTIYVKKSQNMNNDSLFEITYKSEYKTAYIYYNDKTIEFFKNKEFDLLEQGITHEICHIVTGEITEAAMNRFVSEEQIKKSCEKLTESIAQLLRKKY